jgi:hypothetical protein
VLIAALNAVGAGLTAAAFRDRERSQFIYSMLILVAVSASYFFDASPVRLLTRLAIGDYYTGPGDVVQYAALLAVMVAVFFGATKRLAKM